MPEPAIRYADTDVLRIAYADQGPADGTPVILSHGFPFDIHAFDAVVPILVEAGMRVITPYARGFGPTRFLSDDGEKSGQQAARGLDIVRLADALALQRPIVGGFDWGGNASCVVAALWPERIGGLISYAGYDIIDVAAQRVAGTPGLERVCWYQHLFQTERGRDCLTRFRNDLCRMLWQEWSPGGAFDERLFARSAASFANLDFVDVVIHCYRWMSGRESGSSLLAPLEDRLAQKPAIPVPAVTLDGARDPLKPNGTADHAALFVGKHEHQLVASGHNLPQERPEAFAAAVLKVRGWSR